MPSKGAQLQDPLPLVGRTRELRTLASYMRDGGNQDGTSVVIVSGEGGVGKSRLALELARRAADRGWTVAHGRAFPVEVGVPYALLSDAFLPILQELGADSLTVLTRGGEAELRYLFPSLGNDQDKNNGVGSPPEEFRTRLMWNFAEFLKNFAARSPLLCILEDLQWADESSLQLLHFLARQATGEPILILCTYNDTQRDQSLQLIHTERSLVSLGIGEILRLEPLSLDDVTELVALVSGVGVEVVREFSTLLFGWTRGNPFFVEEILKSLVSRGQLGHGSGSWVGCDASDFTLPASIKEAVLIRVAVLSDEARAVADLSAVIGGRASYSLLAAISGLSETQLLEALEELCDHGVVGEQAEPDGIVYDFPHPLVRQTLYNELGLQRARLLHGRVADAMERFYGNRSIQHADELAFHFARTDTSHLRPKAVTYLAAAGRSALERHADHEAKSYLGAALERAEAGGEPAKELAGPLLPELARAHQRLGDYEHAVELWTRALDGIALGNPGRARVHRRLGVCHFWRGRYVQAQAQFDAGLAAAEREKDHAEAVRLRIGKAHSLTEVGRGADATKTLVPALRLAEALDEPSLVARVHRALSALHLWVGPPAKVRRHADEAITLAKQLGDLPTEFWGRFCLATLEGLRGDITRMETAIAQANAVADRARYRTLRLWTTDLSLEPAYCRGEWDEGIALGNKALELARTLNQRVLVPRLCSWTSLIYLRRGQHAEAKRILDEANSIARSGDSGAPVDVLRSVPLHVGHAYYLLAIGSYREAIEAAERGIAVAEGAGYVQWAMYRVLPVLAEACLSAEDTDRAEAVGRRIRDHSERLDHKRGHALADACDALVHWKRGDRTRSVSVMRDAVAVLDEIPMVWDAAWLRRHLAGRLAAIGRTDDASTELERVHEVFARLGAAPELEKTRMQLRELGKRPPPTGVGAGIAGLTPRELEVARLVAKRMSNKAIGKELHMAVRTASTHLSNIYQKLGIRSRGELADIIRDHDRAGLIVDGL